MFKKTALFFSIFITVALCVASISFACPGLNAGTFTFQATLANGTKISGPTTIYQQSGQWFIKLPNQSPYYRINPGSYCLNMDFADNSGNSYWGVLPTVETQGWTVIGGGINNSNVKKQGNFVIHEQIK